MPARFDRDVWVRAVFWEEGFTTPETLCEELLPAGERLVKTAGKLLREGEEILEGRGLVCEGLTFYRESFGLRYLAGVLRSEVAEVG